MIEEPGLPKSVANPERNGKSALQSANPWGQYELGAASDEKMNMIGHDDVSSHSNIELSRRFRGIVCERGVCAI